MDRDSYWCMKCSKHYTRGEHEVGKPPCKVCGHPLNPSHTEDTRIVDPDDVLALQAQREADERHARFEEYYEKRCREQMNDAINRLASNRPLFTNEI